MKYLATFLLAVLLSACGGGADEDTSATKNQPCSPVAGQPSSCK